MSPNFWGPRCCGVDPLTDCNVRWYPIGVGGSPDPLEAWYKLVSGGASQLLPMSIGGTEYLWTISNHGIVQMYFPELADAYSDVDSLAPLWPIYDPPAGAPGVSKGPANAKGYFVMRPSGVADDVAYYAASPLIQLESEEVGDLYFSTDNFDNSWIQYLYNDTPDSFSINGQVGGGSVAGYWNPWSGASPWGGYNMTGAGESADYPAPQFAIDAVVGKIDIQYSPTGDSSFYEIPSGGFWKMFLTQWVGDVPCGQNNSGVLELPAGSGNSHWENYSGNAGFAGDADENDGVFAECSGVDQVSDYLVLSTGFFNSECWDDTWTLTGIELTVRRYAENDSSPVNIKDASLVPYSASNRFNPTLNSYQEQGDDLALTTVKWSDGTEDAVYGGPGDLMGFDLTYAEPENRIWFLYQVRHSSAGCDAFVDGFSVTLYYTDADGNPGSIDSDHTHFYPPGLGNSAVGYPEPHKKIIGEEFGDTTGFKTTFLPDQLPLEITGSELASLLKDKEYLDPRYDVTGTGSLLTPGDKITLTFTYVDGPTSDITYALREGSSDPEHLFFGHWYGIRLVGIGGVTDYPDEVATIHKLNGVNPSIVWSGGAGRGSAHISASDPDTITVFPSRGSSNKAYGVNNVPTTYPGVWSVNQIHTDGSTDIDVGAWVSRYAIYSQFFPSDWTLGDLFYRFLDSFGNMYSTGFGLRKLGPSPDPNAFRHQIWRSNLEEGDGVSFITDDVQGNLWVGGVNSSAVGADNWYCFVAQVNKNSGEVTWRTALPSSAAGRPKYSAVSQILPPGAFSPGQVVYVAANRGVYCLSNDTGEVVGYYPHGRSVSHCAVRTANEVQWLALCGAAAKIDVDPDDYDMTPF